MKKWIFLFIFPLLISCGNGENMATLDDDEASDYDSSGSGDSEEYGEYGEGEEDIYFNFKIAEGKNKKLSQIKPLIVVSVDTSSSMRKFLKKAGSAFQGFTPALSPLDWTIIFVAADGNHMLSSRGVPMSLEDDGKLLWQTKQLTPNMKKHASIFTDTLRIHKLNEYSDERTGNSLSECMLPPGCQWGWNERPMLSLYIALKRNKNLIEGSDIVISIMISDSDESYSQSEDGVTADKLKKALKKHIKKPWINYGIIMKKGDTECLKKSYGMVSEDIYSTQIAQVAEKTGGVNFGLCEKSYVPLAKKIVSDIQKMK